MHRTLRWIVVCGCTLGLLLPAIALGGGARDPAGTAFTYQGRLTDGGVPVTGSYDFRFIVYDAETGGSQVGTTVEMTDVAVEDGLVTVDLDFGDVVGGSALWLEVALRPSGTPNYTILSPRQRLRPGPQGLWSARTDDASNLGGHPDSFFLDTSSADQTKSGKLTLTASSDYGVDARGATAGGHFTTASGTGVASVGVGHAGIYGTGNVVGGHFKDTDDSGECWVGYADMGIKAQGNDQGGFFLNTAGSGQAWVAWGDSGIKAQGNDQGGVFSDADGSGVARAGYGDTGIEAQGNDQGGHFSDANGSGQAWVGQGDIGINAEGTGAGGHFVCSGYSGEAWLAHGESGIDAGGNEQGGHFIDLDQGGEAWVANGGQGIRAQGDATGGAFLDSDSGVVADVAKGASKIVSTGVNSFIQNHPEDPERVIVYGSPEGDEVAVYTRGRARLSGGEAKVALGPTFRWVTDPDLGLTAYVTPREPGCTLYVSEVTTDTLVVRSGEGTDCAFDYIVWGLRIGFEDIPVVQPKQAEAYIPSMKDYREMEAADPELGRYTARSRFLEQRKAMGLVEAPDMTRAQALVAAIHEFDPAVDALEDLLPDGYTGKAGPNGTPRHSQEGRVTETVSETPSKTAAWASEVTPAEGGPDRDLAARSFRSDLARLATRVAVSSPVEPGDVLALDREHPGLLTRAVMSGDPTVVGIVVETAGVTLGEGEAGRGQADALMVSSSTIVPCHVDAGYGAIAPGDLLVASPTPGYAMRASDPLPGSVVAKALEAAAEGRHTIKVLVMLR